MSETKLTRKEFYTTAKNYFTDPEMIAFCDKELAKLAKAKDAPRKETARQLENKEIAVALLKMFEPGVTYTVTDLVNMFDGKYTSQRLTPLLGKLVSDGAVVKSQANRKSVYSLPGVDEEVND